MREDPWASVVAAFESELEAEVVADAAEVLVAEQARTTLAVRLRVGSPVCVTLRTDTVVRGLVVDLVEGFVDVVDGDGDAHLIALDHIDVVSGLAGGLGSDERRVVAGRWSSILRGLEGEPVQVELRSGRLLRGQISAVGADHIDLQADDQRLTVPIKAVTRLRRRHRTDAY